MSQRSAICFLVVNQITELPEIAIQSALLCTGNEIFVGYINFADIEKLPKTSRIHFVDLGSPEYNNVFPNSKYMDFSTASFYEIVQLKWILLQEMLKLNYEYIIYSDIDVFWIENPVKHLESSFDLYPEIDLFIQSFTTIPDQVKLCMGFVAFRNTESIYNFILESSKEHLRELKINDRKGDDEIITEYYAKFNPKWIRELPQSTFPVGSMLNLFATKNKIAGLNPPSPFIFHTNYVIGLRNKRLMLRVFLNRKYKNSLGIRYSLYWRLFNLSKRIRLSLSLISKRVFS